jgi:hypothetical protein
MAVVTPEAARGGAWTMPQGTAWVKVAGIYQRADEYFAEQDGQLADGTPVRRGDRRPYDDGGISTMWLLWSEAEYGLTGRVTLGAQVPYFDLEYDNQFLTTKAHGIGDVRFTGRVALLRRSHRLTARVVWKLPTGATTADPSGISVGDGQDDLDLGLQWGRGLGRRLSWLGAEAGYRVRFEDTDRGWAPGNEWFWSAEAGWGPLASGRLGLKVYYQGLRGSAPEFQTFPTGVPLSNDFDQLEIVAMIDVGRVFLEAGWSKTLGSPTYPATGLWILGVSSKILLGPGS